jgi:hypothetical protein
MLQIWPILHFPTLDDENPYRGKKMSWQAPLWLFLSTGILKGHPSLIFSSFSHFKEAKVSLFS